MNTMSTRKRGQHSASGANSSTDRPQLYKAKAAEPSCPNCGPVCKPTCPRLQWEAHGHQSQVNMVEQERKPVTPQPQVSQASRVSAQDGFHPRPHTTEPLRCFRCQQFGHHVARCTGPLVCGVCSGSHDTKECLQRYKAKEAVKSRCPNCGQGHHSWNPACPARPAPKDTSVRTRRNNSL